jgi:Acetyltransferase (GNAT) domain
MNDQFVTHVCRSIEEVEQIRSIWTSFKCHPNSHIDFYLRVVTSMQGIRRPHVLVLRKGGQPEAMLIGRLERKNVEFRIGYKSLCRSMAWSLTFIYGGFIGNTSEANADTCVRAVMKSLRDGEADLAFFNHLRIGSSLYEVARHSPGFLVRDRFQAPQAHRSMRLPASREQFESAVSTKFRKHQRYKKLFRDHDGDVRVRHFSGTDELDQVIRDVDEIARKTYQRGLGAGFIDNAEMRNRLQVEAEKGWLHTFILYAAGKPCAFWMCNLCGGQLYSGFMGYDPAFGQYSPGMFLITKAIEELSVQNSNASIEHIDWGLGDAEYKTHLSTEDWKEASVHIFAPTAKGVALNLLNSGGAAIDGAAKRVLAKTALLAKIKKSWRGRLRPAAAGRF